MNREKKEQNLIVQELLQYSDFMEEWSYDETYNNNKCMPYILFRLYNDSTIERISISFGDNVGESSNTIIYRPIDLFQMSFWKEIEKVNDSDYSICFSTSASLGGLKYKESDWRKYSGRSLHRLPEYRIPNPINSFDNVWNEYVLHTGTTTLSRHDFCIWVFRLSCLVYDLIEEPLIEERNWKDRYLQLIEFVNMKYNRKYEYFVYKGWDKARRKGYLEHDKAFEYRLEDAKMLLSQFYESIESDGPLEKFLREFYDDFGKLLFERELLLQCDYCSRYIDWVAGKRYCSLIVEGRDCGKRARNKRYYDNNRKKLRKENKASMRSLRAFYKEKGVKK